MRIRHLDPIGVEVSELSTRRRRRRRWRRGCAGLLADRGVRRAARTRTLDDDAFLAFLRGLRRPGLHGRRDAGAGLPGPQRDQQRRAGDAAAQHVPRRHQLRAPAARVHGAAGGAASPSAAGQTLFSNQYRAYETLPADAAANGCAGRTIRHVVTGVELGRGRRGGGRAPGLPPAPALRAHRALPVDARSGAPRSAGWTRPRGRRRSRFLYRALDRARTTLYRHAWSPGDVVMWDNGCVLHQADHDGVVGDRVMHRGMVAGYAGPCT